MKVMLAGDTHRELDHVRYLADEAVRHEVSLIIQLGDFGFLFGTDELALVDGVLQERGLSLLWLDGNHEDFDLLAHLGASPDDLQPTTLSETVTYLPRGWRFTLGGLKFMAFGGAVSVDQHRRTEHVSWWRDESIRDAQVGRAVADGPVDVLLSHDAPGEVPILVDMLNGFALRGGEALKMDEESRANRQRLGQVYDAVRPTLCVHGHYHFFYIDDFTHGRVVGLNRDGSRRESYLILDTEALLP